MLKWLVDVFYFLVLQQLTDSAIKNLAFNCKMLSYLNLAGCKLVSTVTVVSLPSP